MKKPARQKELAKQTLRLYWQHAWKYKPYTIGLLVMAPLTVLIFTFLPPLIVANILQRLSNGDYAHHDIWGSFGPQLLLYTGLLVLGGAILWRIVVILIWKLEMNVIRDINQRIFNHVLSQSANFHANRFGGSLVSQASKFGSSYVRIADTTVFGILPLISAFVFASIILAPKAPLVVGFWIVFSIIFMLAAVYITKYVRELNAVEAKKFNIQTGYLADSITNVLAVKSFAGGAFEKKRFAKATEITKQATTKLMWASFKRDLFFGSMTTGLDSVALVIAVISVMVFNAEIATVFLIVAYSAMLSQRLWDFCQSTLKNYNRALGDAHEMTDILLLEPSVKDPVQPQKSRMHKGAITFQDMSFSHGGPDDEALFQKLSLHISPGEKIGLVGHSGSGKTSLTKLLLRFNDIDSGKILIDDQDIASVTQDDLRRSIAYVPQEPLLFHRSIRENIAYGKPEASEAEVEAAAKKANAHEFIVKLADGYDTLVGERGVKLSGGQRQRIAIARAILKDAPILVLDEATSALDSESEKLIQSALWELMKNRTAIVIAHRLSTIQKMDRILVMEAGHIVEEGTHTTLVKQNGVYAGLWAHQSGTFLED